jgi:hypothetical protein
VELAGRRVEVVEFLERGKGIGENEPAAGAARDETHPQPAAATMERQGLE